MQIATAKAAGVLATTIEQVAALIAGLDVAIAEGWSVTGVIARAPATGSDSPEGTELQVIPSGKAATPENSELILTTVRDRAQTQLDALVAQLGGL